MLDGIQLRRMARDLSAVHGVRAVALGGSRARGTHRPDSDVDLGLYYEDDVDREALGQLAARWAGEPIRVAPSGGWGPWMDSGAWLAIEGTAVDWILRDVRRVEEQCERARRGQFAFHPQPGHPLGFLDVSYAGEVATCIPLCDPSGILAGLAERVTPYPDRCAQQYSSPSGMSTSCLTGLRKAPMVATLRTSRCARPQRRCSSRTVGTLMRANGLLTKNHLCRTSLDCRSTAEASAMPLLRR